MQRIHPRQAWPLHDGATTRRLESNATQALAPHTLMQRAGIAVARLANAIAPHARTVWIVCGAGNNGGDGLEAAAHLQHSGRNVRVTWLGHPKKAPADALASWRHAQAAGVTWTSGLPQDLSPLDLCIDALWGLGLRADLPSTPTRRDSPHAQHLLTAMRQSTAAVLAIDLPSGIHADTGQLAAGLVQPGAQASSDPETALAGTTPGKRVTLSLLTLKPGLFTGSGRDAAGEVWFDDLGIPPPPGEPTAWLTGMPAQQLRPHASHKGSYGDVAVVGGEGLAIRGMAMGGAAWLAASAALHHGAGRVLLHLLDPDIPALDTTQPELMLRHFDALPLEELTVVCGCGGGIAVQQVLQPVIERSSQLVLDADALNALSASNTTARHAAEALRQRAHKGLATVLTPHPLEAARLLGTHTADVQAHRLQAAHQLAQDFRCTVVLKGSGSIIAAPGYAPCINPTGNARLACAGTGDVLAGMVGARLATGISAFNAARDAVFLHGLAADQWPQGTPLTASALAKSKPA